MMFRSLNVNWSKKEATRLPGYLPTPFLFGMDSTWSAPGWDFIFGSQDPGIRQKAADSGWLVESVNLTTPFTQTAAEDFNYRIAIEPIRDLSIQLDAKKNKLDRYQEIFRFDSLSTSFQSHN